MTMYAVLFSMTPYDLTQLEIERERETEEERETEREGEINSYF